MFVRWSITFKSLPVTLRTTMFNIQKFYIEATWNLCVLYGYQYKQTNFALQNIKRLFFIAKLESVYCAVRTESLYITDMFRL